MCQNKRDYYYKYYTYKGHSRGELQNSRVDVCFCALPNTPANLLKVPFKRCTCIQNAVFKHYKHYHGKITTHF